MGVDRGGLHSQAQVPLILVSIRLYSRIIHTVQVAKMMAPILFGQNRFRPKFFRRKLSTKSIFDKKIRAKIFNDKVQTIFLQGHSRDERHRDEPNPQYDALRDLEAHFQSMSDNGRDDPRHRDPNNVVTMSMVGKVAEFFLHGRRDVPAIKKLEMVELLRNWMEDSKDPKSEFIRYQVLLKHIVGKSFEIFPRVKSNLLILKDH